MFSSKNPSPRQLAAFTAIIIACPIALGLYVLDHTFIFSLLTLVVVFAGSYGLILFALQTFIYRKIKLIYKLIYQTKASKREEFYYKNILPQKSIDEVREDVERWAMQRKQQIEMLEQNEQFRKEFLQNLSHELKTPVFAIQGYVDTLKEGALNKPEVNMKFLESASRNVTRLSLLIEDLDKISRLENGTLPLNKEYFIIQDLVKEVFENLFLSGSEKKLKFIIKKGCELVITVFADKEKIRQVISNLLENAIKYSRVGGTIEASFYNVDDNNILIEISDDGPGIAEEHLLRIFERFYRTDQARTRKIGGSGLGLSICKHIIEAHQQQIHVRSKPDVGTTFGFTLQGKKK